MRALREFCLSHHITAMWDQPMAPYTSFRIGGKADALLFPDTEKALCELISFLKCHGMRYRIIGNATNLLIADKGFRGVLISVRRIRCATVMGETVRASCGASWNMLCRMAMNVGLSGMENLAGIPGTVGGGIVMNAGAFGSAVADILAFVSVFDAEQEQTKVLTAKDCVFSYRHSLFADRPSLVVLSADLQLKKASGASVREAVQNNLQKRAATQPLTFPSAGSVFRRPQGYYVGQMVAEAGLCGARVGGAVVSAKHCGFIINAGGATAADVLALMHIIQNKTQEMFGIRLEPEIEYME